VLPRSGIPLWQITDKLTVSAGGGLIFQASAGITVKNQPKTRTSAAAQLCRPIHHECEKSVFTQNFYKYNIFFAKKQAENSFFEKNFHFESGFYIAAGQFS